MQKSYPFDFTFYELEQENKIILVRDQACPHFDLIIQADCPQCLELLEFFQIDHKEDGPRLKIIKFNKNHHGEHHNILYQGIPLSIEPPSRAKTKVKSRAPTSIRSLLKREFERRPSTLLPLPHQQHLINHLGTFDWSVKNIPFWIIMLMGTGKTLATLWALANNPPPERVVYIVGPKSILGMWAKTIEQVVFPKGGMRFIILGYNELQRMCEEDEKLLSNQVVVLDEIHQYRNLQENMRYVLQSLERANALILLTGTPLLNDHLEVEYLFELMGQGHQWDPNHTTPADLERLMKNHVFFYDPKIFDPAMAASQFPQQRMVVKKIPMTWKQSFEYLRAMRQNLNFGGYILSSGQRNSYDSLTRRISNQSQEDKETISPKFAQILEDILHSTPEMFPIVVFSHYKELGASGLLRRLQEQQPNLRVAIITGDTRDRQTIINEYNRGGFDVLFITNAAHQGCDLLGTKQMFIVDVHHSKYDENQTQNRVVRINSHKGIEDPCVVFTKYLSVFPDVPPTREEAQELQQFFESHFLKGSPASIDVSKTLQKLVQNNVTVDERFEEQMVINHQKLLPWMEAIIASSIPFRIFIGNYTSSRRPKQKPPSKTDLPVSNPPPSRSVGAGIRRIGRPSMISSSSSSSSSSHSQPFRVVDLT